MTAVLEAHGVSLAFSGIRALNKVSVSVGAGERVGLIGPNGAGKTTLFCDDVLDLLGIAELAEKPVEALSLGQSRLVEAGRALMTGPQILLLDEPSSGLDRDEARVLAAALRAVQGTQGYAVVFVERFEPGGARGN